MFRLRFFRWSMILLAGLSAAPAVADDAPRATAPAARLIAVVDPKFDAARLKLSSGKFVVAAATDESHKDAPLLLLVLSERDASAGDYDLYHDDTLSSRIYVVRGEKTTSEALPFPSGIGNPSVRLEPRTDPVGAGAESLAAVLGRASETEGASYTETVLRRLNDRLSDVFSVSYRPSEGEGGESQQEPSIDTAPSRFAGFADFTTRVVTTTCPHEASGCTDDVVALSWSYAATTGPNCLVKSASASSTLQEPNSPHAPELAVDGRVETAWCKASKAPAPGSWLKIDLQPQTTLASLQIMPGYGKNDATWKNNDRIKTAQIALDADPPRAVSFTDERRLQDVALPPGRGPVSTILIRIVDVVPGAKFRDACISEVVLKARPQKG